MELFNPGRVIGAVKSSTPIFGWYDSEDEVTDRESTIKPTSRYSVAVVLLVMIGLISRLVFLQVGESANSQLLAQGNRVRERVLLPPRGLIVDRNDEVLAKNVPAFSVELVPADLPDSPAERATIYELLARALNLNAEEISARAEAEGIQSVNPVVLAERLDHDQALKLKLEIDDLPGVNVAELPRREYTDLAGLAHLVGYTGKVTEDELSKNNQRYSVRSIVGRAGIEAEYEFLLQGYPGNEQIEVDAAGYYQRSVGRQLPQSGDLVKLSLDLELQKKASEVLARKLEEVGSNAGVFLALNPINGEILASISLPDFDPNIFTQGISAEEFQSLSEDELSPLTNRAIAGNYPSGSVIKPVVAAGGLADGVITENTTLNVPGQIEVGESIFPDWKVHGLTDVRKAIAVSSNVFFYAVGGGWDKVRGLGVERLDYYMELFGLGKPTQVDLPGEAAGLVPTPAWKKEVKDESWYLGDTYHLSIGQGDLLLTPIQLAVAISAIANGGTLVRPHLLLDHQSLGNIVTSTKESTAIAENILDSYQLGVVKSGMKQAVESGSARRLQSLPVSAGGKTGTAQFGNEDKTHAWFVGFAPYESPEILTVVLVEGGGAGNEVAVPVAEEVLKWYFESHKSD